MTSVAKDILAGLQHVFNSTPVSLHEPEFGERELELIETCLESSFVSSIGPYVGKFELALETYLSHDHAIAVNSGTSALHIALRLAGVSPGDEVLIQSLSFIATANAVSYCGAHVHFVDIWEEDLGIDPLRLRKHLESIAISRENVTINRFTNRPIRAIVIMHTLGHISSMNDLIQVALDFKLELVEDAAEALGSRRFGRHAGTFADLAAISFNGNKIVTTGGGGAILTPIEELAKAARHLTTTARVAGTLEIEHDEIGYNYRMPNLNAALGLAQLERLEDLVGAKRQLHEVYRETFEAIPGLQIYSEPEGSRSNYWLQALLLDTSDILARNCILTSTNDAGYQTRPIWKPLHASEPYKSAFRALLPATENLAQRIICLPSGPGLLTKTHDFA